VQRRGRREQPVTTIDSVEGLLNLVQAGVVEILLGFPRRRPGHRTASSSISIPA
jgi:hypothetical protein